MSQVTKVRLPNGQTMTIEDWTSAEPLYSTVEITSGQFTKLEAFSYGVGGQVPGSATGTLPVTTRRSNWADTNLQGSGGVLPPNEEIVIYSMMIECFTVVYPFDLTTPFGQTTTHIANGLGADVLPQPDPPDVSLLNMLRLQRDLIIRLRISTDGKLYTSHPLGWYPASMGTFQYNSHQQVAFSGNATGTVVGQNGGPDADHKRIFASPFYVEGGDVMVVAFDAPTGSVQGLAVTAIGQSAPNNAQGRIRARVYLDGYRRRPVA
jgi:hypothetical protein